MNTQAIQKKLDEYMETATSEQVVEEFEDLGVEFEEDYQDYIELPVIEIKEDKILIYNFQRKGNSCPAVIMNRAEASLYYIELHKFLTDELNTTTTTNS